MFYFENRIVWLAAEQQQNNVEQTQDKVDEDKERQQIKLEMQALMPIPEMSVKWDANWDHMINGGDSLSGLKMTLAWLQKANADTARAKDILSRAELLDSHPFASTAVRGEIQQFLKRYKNKSTTENENEDFAKFIKQATENLPKNMQLDQEFAVLAGMPGVTEALQDFNFLCSSKSEFGVKGVLKGLPTREKYRELSSGQKADLLKAARAWYESKIDDRHPELQARKDQLKIQLDPRVPDSWQKWLDQDSGESLKYKIEWITQQLPALKTSVNNYQALANNPSIQKLEKVKFINQKDFEAKSRTERNEYLEKIQAEIALYDKDLAQRAGAAKVGDGAEATKIQDKNIEAIDQKEKESTTELQELGTKFKHAEFMKLIEAKEKEHLLRLEKMQEEEKKRSEITNLRAQTTESGGAGFASIFKMMLGFRGGASELLRSDQSDQLRTGQAANDEFYQPARGQEAMNQANNSAQPQAKTETSQPNNLTKPNSSEQGSGQQTPKEGAPQKAENPLQERARQQAIEDVFKDNKQRIAFEKMAGIEGNGATNEEAIRMAQPMLMVRNFDDPKEMKERLKADDRARQLWRQKSKLKAAA